MCTATPHGVRIAALMLLVLVALLPPAADAACTGRIEGDAAFAVGLPQGDLADEVDNTGFGGHLNGGLSFERVPLMIGVGFGALEIGREERKEPFSTTIPDVTVDVITNHRIIYGHVLLRLQPTRGVVRPFLDGLVGFKNFRTTTRIESEEGFEDETVAESTNSDDTALSYGIGGGLQVRVHSKTVPCGEAEKQAAEAGELFAGGQFNIYVTGGAWYLLGGEAEYLKEGSIRRENGAVIYDLSKSSTDVLMIYLGVTLSYPLW
ncbi:MAG: hypothetical protein GF330_05150 [Candidatus Eisenbacteria bacterium]|nr:hypothetical protein [Candidatus Eisenbacteria bacterium]